jgi:hypothetical protein
MKENYLFTDPIVLNKQVLVQRTEEANQGIKPIRNQLDLAQRRLYVPKDSPAKLRIENLSHEMEIRFMYQKTNCTLPSS